MSNNSYVYPAKSLHQNRNKFKMNHQHKTSFKHGRLIPFDLIEVLPGDTFKIDLACLIRMSTPIAPIMDNITMHFAAYFIPLRLCYEHFEETMGANKTGAWTADDTLYPIPTHPVARNVGDGSLKVVPALTGESYDWRTESLGIYLGIVPNYAGNVSPLPGRAYYLVWNEFYRSEAVSAPEPVDLSNSGDILVGETDSAYVDSCMPLGKYPDYFTKCLPEPQKYTSIPFIPDTLDVGIIPSANGTSTATSNPFFANGYDFYKDEFANLKLGSSVSLTGVTGQDIVASVDAAWNNINALRFAFQLQKFYEKDARYGTRFFEMLNGHFGVINPDLVMNRPQFLGEFNFRINIDQVLSTAGYAASPSTTVGAPGANSVTGKGKGLFTASFTEPGYILIVGGTRHEHTYGQGVQRLFKRYDRLDFYDPVFANIGEQPVYKDELMYVSGDSHTAVFGYQEAWAEYRFIPDRVSGILNPSAPGALSYWNLADYFAATPSLDENFIYENRASLARALVTGAAGPDFIIDCYFDTTAVRELPLFSIPGLADHH